MLNIVTKRIDGLPVTTIDNLYSTNECDLIFEELNFLHSKLKSPEDVNGPGTSYRDGIALKHNKGLFLDSCYSDRSISNILQVNRKIFSAEARNLLEKESTFFRYISLSNRDTTKIHYFSNGDYYSSHNDASLITVISWFYNSPKSFFGGDLIFENLVSVECLNNRVVVFPSCLYHEVEKVSIPSDLNGRFGRYSISQFLSIGL